MKFIFGKQLSEEELAKQCKVHNAKAQHILYTTYAPQVKGLCYRYVLDAETAEDITHECFIKILSRINSFEWKGNGSLRAWISKIAVHASLDYIRTNKKLTSISDNVLNYPDNETDDEVHSLFEIVKQKDISKETLLLLLEQISESNRIVFNLYAIDQLKHKEIAELLEISEENSRTRLKRARNQLKELLSVYCNYVPKQLTI